MLDRTALSALYWSTGITQLSPSLPPLSCTNTSTRSFSGPCENIMGNGTAPSLKPLSISGTEDRELVRKKFLLFIALILKKMEAINEAGIQARIIMQGTLHEDGFQRPYV